MTTPPVGVHPWMLAWAAQMGPDQSHQSSPSETRLPNLRASRAKLGRSFLSHPSPAPPSAVTLMQIHTTPQIASTPVAALAIRAPSNSAADPIAMPSALWTWTLRGALNRGAATSRGARWASGRAPSWKRTTTATPRQPSSGHWRTEFSLRSAGRQAVVLRWTGDGSKQSPLRVRPSTGTSTSAHVGASLRATSASVGQLHDS